MPAEKIIINSLKKSFSTIWNNKSWFVLLLMLQIVFFILLSFVSLHYQTKIIESANAMLDYIAKQNLDQASVAQSIIQNKNILGDDPLSIIRNFRNMVHNFRVYLAYLFILTVAFTSVSWGLTTKMIYKFNWKKFIENLWKNFIVLAFILGLIFSFLFALTNISLSEIAINAETVLVKYIPFLIFSIVLVYFLFVSLSLTNKTELKDIVQKTLAVGIKKAHYILFVYIVMILLITSSIALLYYFLESNLFITLVSLALLVFSFVFGRILMANVVGNFN